MRGGYKADKGPGGAGGGGNSQGTGVRRGRKAGNSQLQSGGADF